MPVSPKPGIFRPCFFDNRDVGIGILPEIEQVLIGTLRFRPVARRDERSRQLQARHGVHRIDEHDASMVKDPLELGGRLCGLMSALARAGERAEARQLLGQALGLAKERYVCRFVVAAAYVDLGDTEQALDSLEQAYLQRST